MNFAHFAGFQALSFVDRTVPKKIVIFVGEMNEKGVILHKMQHSSPEEQAHERYKTSCCTLIPSFQGLR